MSIIILQTKPSDWNRIKTELLSIEKQIFGSIAFDEECFETFKHPRAYNLLVYHHGRIIGYLMSQKLSVSGVHCGMKNKHKIFYLESVGILEKYRGKGIGKTLLEKFLSRGQRIGCKAYLLDTREKPMIRLAQHYGFRTVSINKKHFWDGKKWSSAEIMRKDLGEKK